MRIEGHIREKVLYFNPNDLASWKQGIVPDWLIKEPRHRFKYCRTRDQSFDVGRAHYFGSAWFISQLHASVELAWQERYKLGLVRSQGEYAKGNSEIEARIDRTGLERLRQLNVMFPTLFKELPKPKENAEVAFKDPDVVMCAGSRFSFFETKTVGEPIRFLQLESLALLQCLFPEAEVAIIRLVECGRAYSPQNHAYRFELP